MAKSPATRQRERRSRLRKNANAYAKYLQDDRERKMLSKLSMTEEELRKLRRKGRLATQKWRQKHKPENDCNLDVAENTGSSQEDFPYNTASAFKKAKNKTEQELPKSPRKIKVVLKHLSKQYKVKQS